MFYLAVSALTVTTLGLGLFAWGMGLHGRIDRYDLFPLLGLMAWMLMWLHYVSGSLKRYARLADDHAVLKKYFRVTSMVVLVLILLHPALLYAGLFADGLGLPPASTFAVYASDAMRVALVLGYISLTVFLLFELGHWFRKRGWWKYIEYASMAAMFGIFIHALVLGSELSTGWFRGVWLALGVILALSLAYNHWYDRRNKLKDKEE